LGGITGAGKSTFLNQILGCELVPTKDDNEHQGMATTTFSTEVKKVRYNDDNIRMKIHFKSPDDWKFLRVELLSEVDEVDLEKTRNSFLILINFMNK